MGSLGSSESILVSIVALVLLGGATRELDNGMREDSTAIDSGADR